MKQLYPLKFSPIYKEKIWGGNKIKTILNKDFSPFSNCGEMWLISGVEGSQTIVENGFLAHNKLNELVEVYMSELVGDKVYKKFGNEFPILVKVIDANDYLSIQVHPDDELARKRHNSFGKSEMWYIMQAEKKAKLISGFNCKLDKEKYLEHFNNKTLKDILNFEQAKSEDVFFIPSGRVHALCPGLLLTEIQQTSDVTYRIYDWDRVDDKGNSRELHTDLALDALDFKLYDDYKTIYKHKINERVNLVKCPYFTTNILHFDAKFEADYSSLDSFVIYVCQQGSFVLDYFNGKINVNKGEAVLIPAEIENLYLIPKGESTILESYVEL